MPCSPSSNLILAHTHFLLRVFKTPLYEKSLCLCLRKLEPTIFVYVCIAQAVFVFVISFFVFTASDYKYFFITCYRFFIPGKYLFYQCAYHQRAFGRVSYRIGFPMLLWRIFGNITHFNPGCAGSWQNRLSSPFGFFFRNAYLRLL